MVDRLFRSLHYWRSVNREAVQEGFFSWGIKMGLGFIIGAVIILLQLHYGILTTSDMRGRWLSVVWPYISVLAIGYLFHIARAAWRMHEAIEDKLTDEKSDRLKAQSQYTCAIAALNTEVEKLKDDARSRRPTLTIERYGNGPNQFHGMNGFWIANGGNMAAITPIIKSFGVKLYPNKDIFIDFHQHDGPAIIKDKGFIPVRAYRWGDGSPMACGLWDALTEADDNWSELDEALPAPTIVIEALDQLGNCYYTQIKIFADALIKDRFEFHLTGIGECKHLMPQVNQRSLPPAPQSPESTTHEN